MIHPENWMAKPSLRTFRRCSEAKLDGIAVRHPTKRRVFIENLNGSFENPVGMDIAQAGERALEPAPVFHAGYARWGFQLKYVPGLFIGAGAGWIGGPEQGHDRTLQRGGDVHRAGVIGHDQIAEADPFN